MYVCSLDYCCKFWWTTLPSWQKFQYAIKLLYLKLTYSFCKTRLRKKIICSSSLQVLWTLKEQALLENIEVIITDDLFDVVFNWVRGVPESSLLKNALDSSKIFYIINFFIITLSTGISIKKNIFISFQFYAQCVTSDLICSSYYWKDWK